MDGLGGATSGASFVPSLQRPSLFVPSGFRAPLDGGLGASGAPSAVRATGFESRLRLPTSELTRSGTAQNGHDSGVVTSSFMAPIFHLTSDDSTILAMEHNNHVKLLAISSSRLELLVTNTVLMPVIENQGVEASGDDPFASQQAPPLDVRLLNWDPAENSVLVDRLRAPCTQLLWAPWQHGTYLGALSAGCFLHIYRYSHGRWALDATIPASDCIAFAFSCHFTIACACTNGTVRLYSRHSALLSQPAAAGAATATSDARAGSGASPSVLGADSTGSAMLQESGLWEMTSQIHTEPPATAASARFRGLEDADDGDDGRRTPPQPDCLSVSFDEHGQLLVAGYMDGSVRVFTTTHESRRAGAQIFLHDANAGLPASFPDPCQQVAWAPSAGRSFLMLALVFPHRVSLVLFRRPLATANGFGAGGGADVVPGKKGTSAGTDARTTSGLSSGQVAGSARPLTIVATATVACEEVAKLSWNTTGTRFVTSHTDSIVQAWVVQVAYKQEQGDGQGELGGDRDTGRLYLDVSMRKISTVHPYHATNTR